MKDSTRRVAIGLATMRQMVLMAGRDVDRAACLELHKNREQDLGKHAYRRQLISISYLLEEHGLRGLFDQVQPIMVQYMPK